MATSPHRIHASRPKSILRRDIDVDVRQLLLAFLKVGASVLTGNPAGMSTSAADVLAPISLANDVGGLVWLLVARSAARAIHELINRDARLHCSEEDQNRLADWLNNFFHDREWDVEADFLVSPGTTPIVDEAAVLFRNWLTSAGCSAEAVDVAYRGFRGEFVFATAAEWRFNHRLYEPIASALTHALAPALRAETGWRRYHVSLEAQLDERVFDDNFTLRDIYIPLRAICVPDSFPGTKSYIADAATELHRWAAAAWRSDSIRIISGEPGSGKSSLMKVFAAEQSRRRDVRVLFIPLHMFDLHTTLEEGIRAFFAGHDDVPEAVFERGAQYILIFDGLDELVMQGENGPRVASQFLASLDRSLQRWRGGPLLAAVSAREVLVQSISGHFGRHQVLRLAPFHVDPVSGIDDPWQIGAIDQRDIWWRRYGELKNHGYEGMPDALRRPDLGVLSAQPLLNYLLAISYERGRVDFSSTSTVNVVYADLMQSIYERGWGGGRHPAVVRIRSEGDFERVLQEIALATWESGNGRVTTASAAVQRCKRAGLQPLLEDFATTVRDGVVQLLTAFYFRYRDDAVAGERSFEFTHKSFSEYLVARRWVALAVQLASPARALTDAQMNELLSVLDVPFDEYVIAFVRNEVALLPEDDAALLRGGLPIVLTQVMTLDIPSGGGLRLGVQAARRCGAALLAILSAAGAAFRTAAPLPSEGVAGLVNWLPLLAHGRDSATVVALASLSNLALVGLQLRSTDLTGADLERTIMSQSNLQGVIASTARFTFCQMAKSKFTDILAREADFAGANMDDVSVTGGDWSKAKFSGTMLTRARFVGVTLRNTDFGGAFLDDCTFVDCDLTDATLSAAHAPRASFKRSTLARTSFESSVLDGARFERCDSLGTTAFESASVPGVIFRQDDATLPRLSDEQFNAISRRSAQDESDASESRTRRQ